MLSRARLARVCWRAYLRDTRAIAAVEFALVLPLILLLYVGATDVARAVQTSRRLTLLSRTISDLVSRQSTATPTSTSTVSLIFGAATSVMAPFTTTGLHITVSAVDIKAKPDGTCCQALVRWSITQNGTLRACAPALIQVPDGTYSTAANIPSSIILANSNAGFGYTTGSSSYLIIADVSQVYTPFFQSLPPPFGNVAAWFQGGMRRTTYMVPRSPSGTITLATPVTAAAGTSVNSCF